MSETQTLEKTQKEEEKIEVEKEEKETSQKKLRYYEGIGRRKTATARVRLYTKTEGIKDGIEINGRSYKEYFPTLEFQKIVEAPLEKMKLLGKFGVTVKVKGGGIRGQAEAIRLGLARALVKFNPAYKRKLKRAGFLTVDARQVERKKYGKKKARRAPQWQKR